MTQVDYRALARQSADLAAELATAGELTPELADLLARRKAQALRQNRVYGWTALRKRDWPRLGRWLRQHPGNGGAILMAALRKLGGQRGLPD